MADTPGAEIANGFYHKVLSEAPNVRRSLEAFAVQHHPHRPIALVTSGGTAVEIDGVRTLENFSTGHRGAVAVEEFLRRGYAVVHLARGKAPFSRCVEVGSQWMDDVLQATEDDEDEDDIVRAVVEGDPFLTTPPTALDDTRSKQDTLRIKRSLRQSERVRQAWKDRLATKERLLSIPFRSVEDYLGKLQLCCRSLADTSLVIVLAAAVSDFYLASRYEHKVSSTEGWTLKLDPVPKAMGLIPNEWAPQALLISFKLETDETLLLQKAQRAVRKYHCHMVIGNELHTRHELVHVLMPPDWSKVDPSQVDAWSWNTLYRDSTSPDSLESKIVSEMVQAHLEWISWRSNDFQLILQAEQRMQEKARRLQRDRLWNQGREMALRVLSTVGAAWISYQVNMVLQARLRR